MTPGLAIFSLIHVVISVVGIAVGPRRRREGSSPASGSTAGPALPGDHRCHERHRFGFPFEHFLPSHAVAILSPSCCPS